LTMCVADAGKRECDSAAFWLVNVVLTFEE
jgi:hypothetical protein